MITFILNNKLIKTENHQGTTLLDFIRYEMNLPGTKIGCREGDCGACTVLEGTIKDDKVKYKSIVSCLTPLGNAHGKHIVTIEGINMKELSPVQNALVDHAGTQCGFCTPGFVMSLTGHSLSEETSDKEKVIASISGNICRCTGYKSIEKAAESISQLLKIKDINDPVKWLVENKHLPEVIEHLSKAPEFALLFLHSLLNDNGHMICTTPNAAAIFRRFKLLQGYNPYARIRFYCENPGHYREYTKKELTQMGNECGFEIVYHNFISFNTQITNIKSAIVEFITNLIPSFKWSQIIIFKKK